MRNPFSKHSEDGFSGTEDRYGTQDERCHWKDSSDRPDQTVWQGDCYHSYRSPGTPTQGTPAAGPGRSIPAVTGPVPPGRKGHALRKIVAGAAACLVISAGSIAGFVQLINNGTVKLNSGDTPPAFTIQKSGSASSGSVGATNTAASGQLSLEQVAKKVVPSVVCIQNYQVNQRNTYAAGGFSGGNEDGSSGVTPASEGSGIIATKDGYIITNAHVVEGASSLKVILSNAKTYQAKLIGSDSITDLAVLKIDASGLTPAEFGSSEDLEVADTVMAVGNPGGLEFNSTVTVGYISALNRQITNSESGYTMKAIQTDAAINPGNSGGALVNMKGQVVGINSSKIVATGYEGLGFAIPVNEAQPIISDLKAYGYVKDRAVLGITGQFIDSMTARFYGWQTTGMYVVSVTSAEVTKAGIQKGDIITKIDGTEVTSQNVISGVIAKKKPGNTVTLSVIRPLTGQTFTATVKLSQATGK